MHGFVYDSIEMRKGCYDFKALGIDGGEFSVDFFHILRMASKEIEEGR